MLSGLDSSFIIELLRGDPDAIRKSEELEQRDSLVTTNVNYFEVIAGVKSKKDMEMTRIFFRRVKVLPLTELAADHAASIFLDLKKKGIEIHVTDALIAGIFLENKVQKAISSDEHFKRIPSLIVESW